MIPAPAPSNWRKDHLLFGVAMRMEVKEGGEKRLTVPGTAELECVGILDVFVFPHKLQ